MVSINRSGISMAIEYTIVMLSLYAVGLVFGIKNISVEACYNLSLWAIIFSGSGVLFWISHTIMFTFANTFFHYQVRYIMLYISGLWFLAWSVYGAIIMFYKPFYLDCKEHTLALWIYSLSAFFLMISMLITSMINYKKIYKILDYTPEKNSNITEQ